MNVKHDYTLGNFCPCENCKEFKKLENEVDQEWKRDCNCDNGQPQLLHYRASATNCGNCGKWRVIKAACGNNGKHKVERINHDHSYDGNECKRREGIYQCVNCNKKVNEVFHYEEENKDYCLPCKQELERNGKAPWKKKDEKKNDKQKLLKNFEDLNQYYQQKRVKEITYNPRYFNGNHDLKLTDYANNVQFAILTELPTNIQPTLTSYFVDSNNNSLSQQQLNSMISQLQRELENENKPTNYLPWILGGVGIFAFIVLIIYLATRPSKRNRY